MEKMDVKGLHRNDSSDGGVCPYIGLSTMLLWSAVASATLLIITLFYHNRRNGCECRRRQGTLRKFVATQRKPSLGLQWKYPDGKSSFEGGRRRMTDASAGLRSARIAVAADSGSGKDTRQEALPAANVAVIIPGFLFGSNEYEELAAALTDAGVPACVVPLPVWHWLPCLAGRSARPILDRIDNAVRHVAATATPFVATDPAARPSTEGGRVGENDKKQRPADPPPVEYGFADLAVDFVRNPGGIGLGRELDPSVYSYDPRGTYASPPGPPRARVALIGHSAGGWIARAYLSARSYGGRSYNGASLVHSLVTLGTPHSNAEGVAFENVKWVNSEAAPPEVRCLAVAAVGSVGAESGAFTKDAYRFCMTGNEDTDPCVLDGDGVTPVSCAFFRGAESLVLKDVTHAPGYPALIAPELEREYRAGKPWYGSIGVFEKWATWLKAGVEDDASRATS